MRDIYRELKRCMDEGEKCVLATIINVDGSAYQREGARCLFLESGEVIGMVSGGCVEADLMAHAKDVILAAEPRKVIYDFSWDQDVPWGIRAGCTGIISVFLEPFNPLNQKEKASNILKEISVRLDCHKPYHFVMCIESSQPNKFQSGQYLSDYENNSGFNFLNEDTKTGLMETVINDVTVSIFVELVTPLPNLFIIGSGPDAALLAKYAYDLNWRVTVIDHRVKNLADSFPHAQQNIIKRGDFGSVNIPQESFIVLMTHDMDLDHLALQAMIPLNLTYIGVLGSKKRLAKLMELLKAEDQERMADIHSPIGLDIGAQGPKEITVSIMAELIAHKNGRSGGALSKWEPR